MPEENLFNVDSLSWMPSFKVDRVIMNPPYNMHGSGTAIWQKFVKKFVGIADEAVIIAPFGRTFVLTRKYEYKILKTLNEELKHVTSIDIDATWEDFNAAGFSSLAIFKFEKRSLRDWKDVVKDLLPHYYEVIEKIDELIDDAVGKHFREKTDYFIPLKYVFGLGTVNCLSNRPAPVINSKGMKHKAYFTTEDEKTNAESWLSNGLCKFFANLVSFGPLVKYDTFPIPPRQIKDIDDIALFLKLSAETTSWLKKEWQRFNECRNNSKRYYIEEDTARL